MKRCVLLFLLTALVSSVQSTPLQEALDSTTISVETIGTTTWDTVDAPTYDTPDAVASPFADELESASSLRISTEGPATLELLLCRDYGDSEEPENPLNYNIKGDLENASTQTAGIWSSLTFDVPDGPHFLELEVPTQTIHGRVVVDRVYRKQNNPNFYHFGGEIQVSPVNGQDDPDNEYREWLAIPNPGWDFHSWDFQQQGAVGYTSPKVAARLAYYAYAYFSKPINCFGTEFKTGGGRPWIVQNDRLVSQFLPRRLTSWIEKEIEGPAVVSLQADYENLAYIGTGGLTVFLDDEELMEIEDGKLTSMNIPKGNHTLKLETDLTSRNSVSGSTTLSKFEIAYGLELTVGDTPNGEITIKNPKQTYAYGEYVKISAQPAPGYRFLAWIGAAAGNQADTKFAILDHSSINAIFVPETTTVYDEFTFSGNTPWTTDSFYTSPLGTPLLIADGFKENESASVSKQVTGPVAIEFWAMANAFTGRFEFWIDSEKQDIEQPAVDGSSYLFKLDHGTHDLKWSYSGDRYSSDDRLYLGDLVILPPWEIELQTNGSGTISLSPNKEYYEQGETVTVQANPIAPAAFISWAGGLSGKNPTMEIEMDGDLSITGNFTESFEWENVTWQAGGDFLPTLQSTTTSSGDGEALEWVDPSWGGNVWLESTWNGPGLLTAKHLGILWNDTVLSIYVNDTQIHAFDRNTPDFNWDEVAIQIPDGATTVRWELKCDGNEPFFIDDIQFQQGYSLLIESDDGDIIQDPQGRLFPANQTVNIDITSTNQELVFTGWQGTVNARSASLSLTMDQNHHISGSFAHQVTVSDLDYFYSDGMVYTQNQDSQTFTFTDENDSFWFEIEGPSVLSFDRQNDREFNLIIDGAPVDRLEWSGNAWTPTEIPIDAGTHRLQYRIDRFDTGASLSLKNLSITDGYLLDIKSVGTEVNVTPDQRIFPASTTVNVSAQPVSGNGPLNWTGPLAGNPTSFEFQIDSHIYSTAIASLAELPGPLQLKDKAFLSLSWEQNDPSQGTNLLKISPSEETGQLYFLDFEITGPGVLSFSTFEGEGYDGWSTIKYDGETVNAYKYENTGVSKFLIEVGEGVHSLYWEGSYGDQMQDLAFYIQDLVFSSESLYTVDITNQYAENGQITEKSPDKDIYEKGETVTLTAVPPAGAKLLYWTINGTQTTENPVSIDVDSNTEAEAQFGVTFEGENYEFTGPFPIEIVEIENQDVLSIETNNSYSNPGVRRVFLTPGVLTFDYKFSVFNKSRLDVYENGIEKPRSEIPQEGIWNQGRIVLSPNPDEYPNEVLFRFRYYHPSGAFEKVYLKNIQFTPGITIDRTHEYGSIEVTPDKESYPIGDEISIRFVPNDGYDFEHWEPPYSDSANPATVQIGVGSKIKPVASKTFDAFGLTWKSYGQKLWTVKKNDQGSWLDLEGHLSKAPSIIETTVTGPGVFKMRCGQNRFSVNTLEARGNMHLHGDHFQQLANENDFVFYLNEGDTTFQLTNVQDGSSESGAYISSVSFTPGWATVIDGEQTRHSGSDQESIAAPGEPIVVSAYDFIDMKWQGWQGDLLGEPSTIEETAHRHIIATPLYAREIQFAGHTWQTDYDKGWIYDSTKNELKTRDGYSFRETSSITTSVQGPAIIRYSWENTKPENSLGLQLLIDGALVNSHAETGNNPPAVDIPEGIHTIEFRNNIIPGSAYYDARSQSSITFFEKTPVNLHSGWITVLSNTFGPYLTRQWTNTDPLEDSDHDNIPLIIEVFTGRDPNTADQENFYTIVEDASGNSFIQIRTLKDSLGKGVQIQTSHNLVDWENIDPQNYIAEEEPQQSGIETLKIPINDSQLNSNIFLKLSASY